MAKTSSFTIRDNAGKRRFEADLGDGSLAIADYEMGDGKIVFTHTKVPPAHEGKGIGSALIRFALRSAQARGLAVVPICPFFATYMRKHHEERDLLDPSFELDSGAP